MADAARVDQIRAWLDGIRPEPLATPPAPSAQFVRAAGTPFLELQERLEQLRQVRPDPPVPVVSEAAVGGDLGAEILERSRKLKALRDAGDLDAGLAFFRESPADGCTSIVDLARINSGYDPRHASAAENFRRFQCFAATIVEAPVFEKRVLDQRPFTWKPASWAESVRRVLGLFPKISAADAGQIKRSLERMTRAAAANPGRTQTDSLFVQNMLFAEGADYQVFLYYATASFKEIHQKKKDPVHQTSITVARAQLSFLTEAWPAYAEAVWNKHVCAVTDWLDRNTTEEAGPSPVSLCFD